jgi:hypothetical protein
MMLVLGFLVFKKPCCSKRPVELQMFSNLGKKQVYAIFRLLQAKIVHRKQGGAPEIATDSAHTHDFSLARSGQSTCLPFCSTFFFHSSALGVRHLFLLSLFSLSTPH